MGRYDPTPICRSYKMIKIKTNITMKKTVILLLMLLFVINVNAQFKVNSAGKIAACSSNPDFFPRFSIGNSCYFGGGSIGLAATPAIQENNKNVAIEGYVNSSTSYTSDSNYGVFGITKANPNHGRNYGVSGMLDFNTGNTSGGGAGIYAADYSYLFSFPDNLQGYYALYVHGATNLQGLTTALEIYTPADERLSENVESIEEQNRNEGQTLDNLLKMNVLEFNMKNHDGVKASDIKDEMTEEDRQAYEYLKNREDKMYSRRHFGLSAQKLQAIYPNLVLEGQDGYLYVNYTELVPILIRSIQELKADLDEVKSENEAFKARSATYEDDETTDVSDATAIPSAATLAQNTPNPFSERTTIRFTLPENAQNAFIYIFDMSGKMYKQIPVNSSMQSVTIEGYELRAGMYIYSLVIGGKEIQTRRMILSK